MKILVTGTNGQLGHDVVNELIQRGHTAFGSGRYSKGGDTSEYASLYIQMDITDEVSVHTILHTLKPDAVIHCAAWTAVDEAEEKTAIAFAVNSSGTKNIAAACREIGCKMMYISTDYVFDGLGVKPWQPDCIDYHPLNIYGKSKLEGEKAVSALVKRYFIVRTSWVFGSNGSNFVKTILNIGRKNPTLRVVNDQIGRPTYTCDLAKLLVDMIESEKYGYYHASNEGEYISWYDFACEIICRARLKAAVVPVSTTEYGQSKALRPANSRLDTSKLERAGFNPLPDWRNALMRYLESYKESF